MPIPPAPEESEHDVVADIVTVLLTEFVGDGTKSSARQLTLLGSLAILISSGVLELKDATLLGLKLTPAAPVVVYFLLGVGAAFLLLQHGIEALFDWRRSRYERLRVTKDIRRFSDAWEVEQDARIRRLNMLRDQTDLALQERARRAYEIAEGAPAPERPKSGAFEPTQPSYKDKATYAEQFAAWEEDRQQKRAAYDAHCASDGLTALLAEIEGLTHKTDLHRAAQDLIGAHGTATALKVYLAVVYVVLPLALGIAATLLSFRAFWTALSALPHHGLSHAIALM